MLQARRPAQPPRRLEPVDDGHHEVHQHDVGAHRHRSFEGLLPVRRLHDPEPERDEEAREQAPVDGLVVHDEDGRTADHAGDAARRRVGPVAGVEHADGEPGGERAPLTGGALEPDRAAHHVHEAAADGEPEPGALAMPARIGDLLERLEHPLRLLRRDPDAGVGDFEAEHDASLVAGGVIGLLVRVGTERDGAAGRELHRVREEVEEDLPEPPLVGMDGGGERRREVGGEGEPFRVGLDAGEGGDGPEEVGEAERRGPHLELARLDLGEVEHVVDEAEEVVPAPLDHVDARAVLVGEGLVAAEELGVAEDAVERCPELVAHLGEERALGTVGGLGAVARFGEGGLGPPPLFDLGLRRLVEPGVGDRDRGLVRHPREEGFMLRGEPVGLGVPEDQPADDGAVAILHGRGEERAYGRMVRGHPAVGAVVAAVARVGEDVADAEHALAGERRAEDVGHPREGVVRERLAGRTGESVAGVGLIAPHLDVVEERANLGADDLAAGVDEALDESVEVELGGEHGVRLVERAEHAGLLAEAAGGLLAVGDV